MKRVAMAKNRVAPDIPKPKNKFSDRSQSTFKSRIKIGQNKRKFNTPNFHNKNQPISEEHYNKAKSSGSAFFVKPNNNTARSEIFEKSNNTNIDTDKLQPKPKSSGSAFFVKPNYNTARRKVFEKPKDTNIDTDELKSDKKPFNKKKYRLQKYSNKYKLQQWEDKRKKAVLRGYYRSLKEDGRKLDVKRIYEEHEGDVDSENENVDEKGRQENENNLKAIISQSSRNTSTFEEKLIAPENSKGKKNKAFKKAHLEFQRIKEEKQKRNEELLKKKAEKKEALEEYKRKKVEKYKKLNRKTKRGQPIMKDRIEMLLEKIQNSI